MVILYCLIVSWWLEMNGWFQANAWNNKTSRNIFSFLEYFVYIWDILSITSNKVPIKTQNGTYFEVSTWWMLNDAHLKVIKLSCESDKRSQLSDCA